MLITLHTSRQTVKYRNQEWLCWRGPAAIYQTGEQKHKDNVHKASLGNNTVEKLPVDNKVVLINPVKVINNNNNNLIIYLF
jgi:hypothetical protein